MENFVNVTPPVFPDQLFLVSDFGTNDDKHAIQKALDACGKSGGGRVSVPAGSWKTTALRMMSNTELHLEDGAILDFSTELADYLPVEFTRWEGIECYNYCPLIYAINCENLAVTGNGTLKGNGQAWWHWKQLQHTGAKKLYDAEANGIPVEQRIFGNDIDALRPQFIQFIYSRNILISDIRIEDGPQWTIHPVYCENIIIRNITIDTDGPNTDGLNPDSCCNVLIENSDFATGDDCIAINSGMNEDGWRVNRPCENVLIRNCRMTRGHGGVVIGSGMSGGVRNIVAHDCAIDGTEMGIRLKSMRGRGGVVENILFRDCQVTNIIGQAIQVNMFYGATTIDPTSAVPPLFRNITMENITGSGGVGIQLKGLPESRLENITLRHVHITAPDAVECTDVAGLTLEDIQISAE